MTEISIKEKEKKVIEEFSSFEDWMDKYTYIIDLGKELEPLDEKFKKDNFLIKGCQSQVWINAEYKDGRVYYFADSDALITKGIIKLLIMVLSGSTTDEIINSNLEFIEHIGLKEHLSPTRANGLVSMIKQMKLFAIAFKSKE